jgi:hypothetical protein
VKSGYEGKAGGLRELFCKKEATLTNEAPAMTAKYIKYPMYFA